MTATNEQYHPLSPFGKEVTGLSLKSITPQQINTLKGHLATSGVVVIRNQAVDDRMFVDFLRRLGPLTFTVGETPVANAPQLNIVSNVGRDRPPRSVFHTDTSYVTTPPAYTSLKPKALPQKGGETLFSNQYIAYTRLPADIQQALEKVSVLHRVTGLDPEKVDQTHSWHPLFKRHPISRRFALFLSTPERCQALSVSSNSEELSDSPSDFFETPIGKKHSAKKIIRLLYRHSIRPRWLYRHCWQPGDIVVWDNRCTMHRADHSQVVGDRIFHRGLVADNTAT